MSIFKQVEAGDCCSSLAAQYGFADYKPFYDQQSGAFKAHHPNPNQLTPKYPYVVPEIKAKQSSAATTRVHEFQIRDSNVNLKIRLLDANDQPLKVTCCVLQLGAAQGGRIFVIPPAALAGEGINAKNIHLDVIEGSLKIRLASPSVPAAPEPLKPPIYTANARMPYPPSLQAGAFQDQDETDYIGTFEEEIEWRLQIGSLATHKEEIGISARLANLGFSLNQGLPAAVQAFQTWFNGKHHLNRGLTGNWQDIQDDIKHVHDDP